MVNFHSEVPKDSTSPAASNSSPPVGKLTPIMAKLHEAGIKDDTTKAAADRMAQASLATGTGLARQEKNACSAVSTGTGGKAELTEKVKTVAGDNALLGQVRRPAGPKGRKLPSRQGRAPKQVETSRTAPSVATPINKAEPNVGEGAKRVEQSVDKRGSFTAGLARNEDEKPLSEANMTSIEKSSQDTQNTADRTEDAVFSTWENIMLTFGRNRGKVEKRRDARIQKKIETVTTAVEGGATSSSEGAAALSSLREYSTSRYQDLVQRLKSGDLNSENKKNSHDILNEVTNTNFQSFLDSSTKGVSPKAQEFLERTLETLIDDDPSAAGLSNTLQRDVGASAREVAQTVGDSFVLAYHRALDSEDEARASEFLKKLEFLNPDRVRKESIEGAARQYRLAYQAGDEAKANRHLGDLQAADPDKATQEHVNQLVNRLDQLSKNMGPETAATLKELVDLSPEDAKEYLAVFNEKLREAIKKGDRELFNNVKAAIDTVDEGAFDKLHASALSTLIEDSEAGDQRDQWLRDLKNLDGDLEAKSRERVLLLELTKAEGKQKSQLMDELRTQYPNRASELEEKNAPNEIKEQGRASLDQIKKQPNYKVLDDAVKARQGLKSGSSPKKKSKARRQVAKSLEKIDLPTVNSNTPDMVVSLTALSSLHGVAAGAYLASLASEDPEKAAEVLSKAVLDSNRIDELAASVVDLLSLEKAADFIKCSNDYCLAAHTGAAPTFLRINSVYTKMYQQLGIKHVLPSFGKKLKPFFEEAKCDRMLPVCTDPNNVELRLQWERDVELVTETAHSFISMLEDIYENDKSPGFEAYIDIVDDLYSKAEASGKFAPGEALMPVRNQHFLRREIPLLTSPEGFIGLTTRTREERRLLLLTSKVIQNAVNQTSKVKEKGMEPFTPLQHEIEEKITEMTKRLVPSAASS